MKELVELIDRWKERIDECCRLSNQNKDMKELLMPIATATAFCMMELQNSMKEMK